MTDANQASSQSISSLEGLMRRYLETTGGAWDEVEPQVYDVLLPSGGNAPAGSSAGGTLMRIAFDPEALPEHPGAQLASYGTPFIDQLLNDAVQRGRRGRFYLVGLNLSPHDLGDRLRRALTFPPPLELRIERVRALHFTQAVFWFQAEFVSDQKEQEVVPVAMDLHYGREVRQLEALLEPSRLAEHPSLPLPEARRSSVGVVYPAARDRVLRTFSPMINVRNRELTDRLERQIARMTRYYADLRSELEDQRRRAHDKAEVEARLEPRRRAIDREEELRVAELRQKSTLRVNLRLLQVVVIEQPKLLVHTLVSAPNRNPVRLEVVWDPLLELVEAVPCPECQRPTYAFELDRQGRLVCSSCNARAATPASRKPPR